MSNKINLQFGVITLMILVAAITRLLPHPPNFTAVGAMGLFGAAFFNRKVFAFLIPLIAMYMTDLFLNNVVYAAYLPEGTNFIWFTGGAIWIYGAIALTIVAGSSIFSKASGNKSNESVLDAYDESGTTSTVTPLKVVSGSLASAVIFYLLTNFGVWLSGTMYPTNFAGFMACYIAAIPYFFYTLLGNLFYGGVLFGSYFAIQKRYFARTTAV